ncbi:MAG: FkbM family methyltransferase [Simkaniaceae bacterium]|nr:FkbM family methyltransferase [Simkaniaceae bacterium]
MFWNFFRLNVLIPLLLVAGDYQIYDLGLYGTYKVDKRDRTIKGFIRGGRPWEKSHVDRTLALLKEGSVFVDLGAHIGTWAIPVAKKVGPTGHVYAFEPQANIYSELRENIALNNLSNITTFQVALGECEKLATLEPILPDNEGARCIGEGDEVVQMRPLDSYDFERIDFLKIDVENYELKVLEGARATILKHRPIIHLELFGHLQQAERLGLDVVSLRKQGVSLVESLRYKSKKLRGNNWMFFPVED